MNNQNHTQISSSNKSIPRLKLLDFSLRISVIPLSIASLCLTINTNEDNPDYGSIKFLNFSGLKYMVAVAAIAAGYALIAAISTWISCLVNKAWVFFISDQVMAYLMVTSGTAGAEIMYLAYKGDIEVSWSEACSAYGKFCTNLKIAVILHFLALFCFLFLAVISAFRAFSMFDPPFINTQLDEVERT
ncbi:CASP-like protein 2D1 [Chenopodium quinoa]|uniref:CASP-like protein 2D1 n=1 Tax=Chenopodium quinoa TaxID=63459 RepID=UPI000B798BC7|nr:CASP-like protein 2D1 [Chenopodium quinoa]